MVEVIQFFSDYVVLIYLLLLVGLMFAIRRLLRSQREKGEAVFGLETELARHHQNQAIAALVAIGLLALAELILVAFLVPALPGLLTLATPTTDLAAIPVRTFAPQFFTTGSPGGSMETFTIEPSTCIPGQIMITSHKSGDQIRGNIILIGSANVPNFGFYKYEFSPSGMDDWTTIQAGRKIVEDAKLGEWDTSELTPGDYQLRLVVTDNEGRALPACVIQVRVLQP